ncbi:MAG: peptide ABC transporter substrate-binding protein [Chloroflexota bacterium]
MSNSFKPQAIVGLVAVALLLAIFTGMAGAGKNTPRQRSGDTYVEAMVGAPRFVNPLLAVSDTDTDLVHLVYNGLARVDASGNLVPDLASGWTPSPDSSVYTYTLRPDLRWQDGEPLTADDVFFTLKTLLQDPAFPGDPALAQHWKGVDIKLMGTQTVEFTLPAPDASFPQYTTLGILPRHLWGTVKSADLPSSEYNQAPIGSGPWRYSQVNTSAATQGPVVSALVTPSANALPPSDGVLLEPNEYMPGEERKVSRIWFRLYPTFGAALSGLKMGEVHGLGHIPSERVNEVAAVKDVTFHREPLARYNMLLLNVQSTIFDKPETRQAFELAIDRDAIARRQDGEYVPASSPVLTHSWAYDPSVKSGPYDPAEARRLLDSVGWAVGSDGIRVRNGLTMTVVLAANKDIPANVTAAKLATDDLRAVGVDARTVLVSREALLHDYLGPRAFHIVLAGWEANGADIDVYQYWHSSQAVTGGLNFAGWTNAAADKALQDGHTNPDHEARKRAYSDFQRVFAEDVPAIILESPLYTYATRLPAHGVTLPDSDMMSAAARFDTFSTWSLQVP